MNKTRTVRFLVGYNARVSDGNVGTMIEFKSLKHFDTHLEAVQFALTCVTVNYVLHIKEVYVLEE
jgi:hypothetical protein